MSKQVLDAQNCQKKSSNWSEICTALLWRVFSPFVKFVDFLFNYCPKLVRTPGNDFEVELLAVSVKVIVQKIHSNLSEEGISRCVKWIKAAAPLLDSRKIRCKCTRTIAVSHISCKIMYAARLSWCVFLAVQVVHSIKGAKRGEGTLCFAVGQFIETDHF